MHLCTYEHHFENAQEVATIHFKTRRDFEIAEDLQRRGIPLHEDALNRERRHFGGLCLYQSGSIVESQIFDLWCGMGVVLSLALESDAIENIRIAEYRLEFPWFEGQFGWMQDPLTMCPREFSYAFPKPSLLVFERHAVLNHRVGLHGLLRPGGRLDGLLLGVGQSRIPEQIQNRQKLEVQLRVFDSRGRDYAATFALFTLRETLHKNRGPRVSTQKEMKLAGVF